MTNREQELINKGLQYEERERGDLIDNCYRARLISDYVNVPYTTEELRNMYRRYFR